MKKRFHESLWVAGVALAVIASACARTSSAPPEQTAVQPPVPPHISHEPTSVGEARKLPPVSQPVALHDELGSLKEGTLEQRIAKLKKKVLSDLVFMRGGTYMMGDFGEIQSHEKLPWTPGIDNKPLHRVTLDSFSVSRYKTTFAEYDVFLDATGKPPEDDNVLPYRNQYVPAGMTWYQAKAYCQWLGQQTGVPFDLPTEAQWEYAARSRGQLFLFGTDNGNLDLGRNIDTVEQQELISPLSDNVSKRGRYRGEHVRLIAGYPVGMFPPNPIGLYDVNSNGREWMNDWYEADYYKHSPEMNPKGPASGKWKVARSAYVLEGESGKTNLSRYQDDPALIVNFRTGKPITFFPAGHGVRCVANLDHPVSQ